MKIWDELRHLTPPDPVEDRMVRGPQGARIRGENNNNKRVLSRRVGLRQAPSAIQRFHKQGSASSARVRYSKHDRSSWFQQA